MNAAVGASRRIYRDVIPVDDQWHELRLCGPIVHVATRHEDAVEVWHVHDPGQPVTVHAFCVVGTGHPVPPDAVDHVGSAITPSCRFVWHLMLRAQPGQGG